MALASVRDDTAHMKVLLAIVLPPIGLLSVGKPFQALLCHFLMITVSGWPIAALWAALVVHGAETESRVRRLLEDDRRRR